MHFSDIVKESIVSLTANRLRSVLAVFGIVIGVSSISVMVAIAEGGQQSVRHAIENMGSNVLTVSLLGSAPTASGHINPGALMVGFSAEDVEALSDNPNFTHVAPVTNAENSTVIFGSSNLQARIIGSSSDYFSTLQWKIEHGAAFADADLRRNNRVAVIGQKLANSLFGQDDPLGQIVRVGQLPVQVVGVLAKRGSDIGGNDLDNIMVVPVDMAEQRIIKNPFDRKIALLMVKIRSGTPLPAATRVIEDTLRSVHHMHPDDPNYFSIRTSASLVKTPTKTNRIMTLLLGSIAAISMLAGGIGIMNIMYVCVSERTAEIGIRKLIGAHDRDILLQFIIEATLLCLIGSFCGSLLGLGGIWVSRTYLGIDAIVSYKIFLAAIGTALIVGTFFGYCPARKAARLLPVVALR